MASISLCEARKVFSGGHPAVDGVNLEIADGEFLVLLGPSGCGKTTLLRAIAGLEPLSEGTVLIGDKDVTKLPPRSRDIAMIFQTYALYPHMNVRRNLGYGLKVRGAPKGEIDKRVTDAAEMLGLTDLLERRPGQLSGGQRQRVAMGRAIVREPAAFLMDEPLSNLDAKLRVSMRTELLALHQRLSVTTVYVTHDQVEAMTLGDRVAVMRAGRIEQIGSPSELYRKPTNAFVAGFIGSPPMNLVEARITDDVLAFGQFALPLERRPVSPLPDDGRILLGIRPEAFREVPPGVAPNGHAIDVVCSIVEDLGADAYVVFALARLGKAADLAALSGDARRNQIASSSTLMARVDPGCEPRPGSNLSLTLDQSGLHFFDAASGERIL